MKTTAKPFRTGTAVATIVISVAALSLGDAIVKATGLALPLWQMFILRSAIVIPVLWWLLRRRGKIVWANIGWVLLRSVLLVCMWLSYYSALSSMSLSLAAAAYYTGPIFIVALAALIARRKPSIRVALAIVGGFIGVLLVVRPDTADIALATWLPIIAAFLYGCAMVLTSAKCREDDPLVLALILNASFIGCGALLWMFAGRQGSFILGTSQTLDLQLLATVAALAVLVLIGSVGAAFAYQNGPPATIAAFDYSYLVFSLIWSGLFFNELPDIVGLFGIGVIAGAGFLALPRRQV